MPITDQEIERLEALAGKATPGPWSHEPTSFNKLDRILYSNRTESMHGLNLMKLADGDWNHVNNVEFIAAANPSTVLSLIERLRELEAMVCDAYQFAGNILDIAGLFEHPEGQRALDYFSRGKADPEWRWPNEELSCGKVGGDDDSR